MLKLIIKEVAEKQGLNRSQLQLRSGVTMPLLTRYWTNKTESVTLPALERIAHALAGFQRHDLGQLGAMRLDGVGDGVQDLAPAHAGRRRPGRLGLAGAGDGGRHVGLARAGEAPDRLTRVRAQDVELFAALGRAIRAGDQIGDEVGIGGQGDRPVTSR